MKNLLRILLSISLLYGGIGAVCAHNPQFRSDQLGEMSKHVDLRLDSVEGDTLLLTNRGNLEVAARVADGCVEHIGYRLFPEEQRGAIMHPLVADFVERYWLWLTLPVERQKSVAQQMKEDNFRFLAGNVESVGKIQQDSTLLINCYATDKEMTVAWGDENNPKCCISFPINHELILGRKMLENDRRLPMEIATVDVEKAPAYMIDAGRYLDENLSSERYFNGDEPIFDPEKPMESITNLFTGYDIAQADSIALNIRHKTFGLNEQAISSTVRRFVAYAMQNGCRPYAGIVAIDNNMADVLVIFNNQAVGYNHVLRVSLPIDCIANGRGTATARLNAFVPSSNIKNLFKD